jgi:hypothetical protein
MGVLRPPTTWKAEPRSLRNANPPFADGDVEPMSEAPPKSFQLTRLQRRLGPLFVIQSEVAFCI